MTKEAQMALAEWLKVPPVLIGYGHGIALLYAVLWWLSHGGSKQVNTTLEELAAILYRSKKWIRKRMKQLQELGLIAATYDAHGYTIQVYPIKVLPKMGITQNGYYPKEAIPQDEPTDTEKSAGDTQIGYYPNGVIPQKGNTQKGQGVLPKKGMTPYPKRVIPPPDEPAADAALEGPKEYKEYKEVSLYIQEKEEGANAPVGAGAPTPAKEESEDLMQPVVPKPDPVKELVKAYNEICVSLPKVRKISDERRQVARRRLKEYGHDRLVSIFKRVEASDFLTGRLPGKTWRADFDWIMKKKNLTRIEEGIYDNRQPRKRQTHSYEGLDDTERLLKRLKGAN